MGVVEDRRTWTDAALADAIRDHLRLELIGMGHNATDGAVHVTDHGILAHVGRPSLFNRATALDMEQFDVAMSEVADFYGDLPHTLWIEGDKATGEVDGLLRTRGYLPLPVQQGMATSELGGDELAHHDPDHHPELITTTSDAARIADVTATGFGWGVDDRLLFEDLARAILRHARPWQHGAIYGIRHGEMMRCAGALLCTTDSAGVTGVVTRPEDRHGGFASHVVARAMHDASALGYGAAVAIATPDSVGLLESLGFRRIIDFRVYRQART